MNCPTIFSARSILLISTFFFFTSYSLHSQSFSSTDIEGYWERSDGMVVNISGITKWADGARGSLSEPGSDRYIKSVQSQFEKFINLKHLGRNTWKGGAGYYYQRGGKVVELWHGDTTITMSDNKKSFVSSEVPGKHGLRAAKRTYWKVTYVNGNWQRL